MVVRRDIQWVELNGDTLGRVMRITQERLGVRPDAVFPEASFVEDLDTDSLEKAELPARAGHGAGSLVGDHGGGQDRDERSGRVLPG
jgi:hypothetical protein